MPARRTSSDHWSEPPWAEGDIRKLARHESTMASTRRFGTETSKTRAVLLDVTERLMLDSGYAAVSFTDRGREGGGEGSARALLLPDPRRPVHCRLPTSDRAEPRSIGGLAKRVRPALVGHLGVQQRQNRDGPHPGVHRLANHRKAIQAEIAKTAESDYDRYNLRASAACYPDTASTPT